MRPVCHSLGHVYVVLTSAKSNDITNIFAKSILVQKIAYSSIYDIIISLATPPPIAYKYNKNKNLIFWYKPLELPTDFTLYFP